MFKSPILLAIATLLTVSTIAQSASAGCGTRRYSYPVRVVHNRVVVHRPVVVTNPPIIRQPLLAPTCPQVPTGSRLTLPANFLGPHAGHVFLSVQGTKLPANILAWSNTSVTIQLPPMAVAAPLPASLDILLPHGQLAKRTRILLVAPPQLLIHESGPQAPLPTLSNPMPNAPVAPQGGDILLPLKPSQPTGTGPVAPPMNGGAGIPFAPQQVPQAPLSAAPSNASAIRASANLLDAINDSTDAE
ncbi:MAG TPA: hypothetical protein DCY79_25550 [Planctomycetaceae bacterium]|nr:hypothetical protein [Blastopirellula sp.]HAY83186.1 hypothetical protein [Planctomycetaceae bacterium]|tara:strand:+ start:869 stop:1603 length:735 start_codon:yes stop_codon:yes gene_type:complete